MTNDMIVNLVSVQKEDSEEEEGEVWTEVVKEMSHTGGLNAMETALRCVGHQDDTTADDLLLRRRVRNIAAKKRVTAVKQKTKIFLNESLKYTVYNNNNLWTPNGPSVLSEFTIIRSDLGPPLPRIIGTVLFIRAFFLSFPWAWCAGRSPHTTHVITTRNNILVII
jgi:hypothetical protein